MTWMLVALAVFTLPLLLLYQSIVQQWQVSVPMTMIMIVAGFFVCVGIGIFGWHGGFF